MNCLPMEPASVFSVPIPATGGMRSQQSGVLEITGAAAAPRLVISVAYVSHPAPVCQ